MRAISCSTDHQDSHKNHPQIYGRPSTRTPNLRFLLSTSSQARFRWWPSAKHGCDCTTTAQPRASTGRRGAATAAWDWVVLSSLVAQQAQGAQRASTGLLGFTPPVLSYSSPSPSENLKIDGWNQSYCNFSDHYQELA